MFVQQNSLSSGVFITFHGNCRKALRFYQGCFGGTLHIESMDLPGCPEQPVISGSLVADCISIYGSDLVHTGGRKVGNHLAVFLPCKDAAERKALAEKLSPGRIPVFTPSDHEQPLLELSDAFDVTWVLGIGEQG